MSSRMPTSLAIARARKRFDAGAPLTDLARSLNVTEATFRKWRKAWKWPSRSTPSVGSASTAAPAPLDDDVFGTVSPGVAAPGRRDSDPPDTPRLIRGVRRAIEAELKALNAQSGNPTGGEARTRALTNLTRTLALIRDLETQVQQKAGSTDHDDADAPPVDVAQLRHELARRIHRLRGTGDDS